MLRTTYLALEGVRVAVEIGLGLEEMEVETLLKLDGALNGSVFAGHVRFLLDRLEDLLLIESTKNSTSIKWISDTATNCQQQCSWA